MENTPLDNDSAKPNIIAQYEHHSHTNRSLYLEVDDFERIAEHYLLSDKLGDAHKVIDKGLQQHVYNVELYKLKATVFLAQQRFANALDVIERAFSLSPEDLELKLLKLECTAFTGDERLALAKINSLLLVSDQEDSISILFLKAKIYEKISDYESIFDTLAEVLRIDPNNKTALEKVWFCVELSGKYEESVKLHKSLIDEFPYNYLAWHNLGHAYTCLEDLDNALIAYEYTFLINEDFEYGYRDYVEILISKSEFDKALETLEEIRDKFGNDASIFLNMGQCYLQLENYGSAFNYLIKAKEFDPLESKIYFLLGLCEMAGMNYDSAIYYLSIAVELDNLKEEYYEALSSVYMLKGDFDAAVKSLKNAIDIAPENWFFTIELAKIYLELFQYDKAYTTLLNVESLLDAAEVRYCLAVCQILMGEEAEGIERLSDELKKAYDHHYILKELNIPEQYDELIDDMIAQFHP